MRIQGADTELDNINLQERIPESAAAGLRNAEEGAPDGMGGAGGEYDQPSLFDTSDEELTAAIEAILFAMGESVGMDAMAKALGVRTSRIRQGVALLQKRRDAPGSGIMIRVFDNSVQMTTRPEQYENLIKIAKVPKKITLSDAVMETLSIIAYRQPVTRAEVEEVRGVSCDYAINRLLEYDLICEMGRREVPGRPILFGTTEQFLRTFGLSDLSELPVVDSASQEDLRIEAEAEVDSRLGI